MFTFGSRHASENSVRVGFAGHNCSKFYNHYYIYKAYLCGMACLGGIFGAPSPVELRSHLPTPPEPGLDGVTV